MNNLRTKQIDLHPDKASLVRKAFELYGTGDYTLNAIAREMKAEGLYRISKHIGGVATGKSC